MDCTSPFMSSHKAFDEYYDFLLASIRSADTGIWCTLAPEAWNTAFAIAPPTQRMAGSPPPCGGAFMSSTKTASTGAVVENLVIS